MMTPRTFSPASKAARARRTSSRSWTPPETITGTACARARAMVASTSAPAPVPSRRMSVKTIDTAAPCAARGDEPERGSARLLGAPRDPECILRPALEPAAHRDAAVALIDADRDAAGMPVTGSVEQVRIRDRSGPQDRAVGTGVENARDRIEIAKPAAHLNGQVERGPDRGDPRAVCARPACGAVEVDDVEPAPSLALPALRHRDRVVAVTRLRAEVALPEAHP